MRATVVSVREDTAATMLAASLTIGATTVALDSARDFPTTGAASIGGHTLPYTGILYADEDDGVTTDTLVLAGTSPVAASRFAAVSLPGSVEFVAQVRPHGSGETLDAILLPELAAQKAFEPTPLSGALVECQWRGRGTSRRLWLVNIIGRAPAVRAETIAAGNFPTGVDFETMPASVTAAIGVVSGSVATLSSALSGKADKASPTFTGTVTLPATGAGASEAATRSFVLAAVAGGGGGGGGTGGIDIDCGGPTDVGIDIDCGAP